MIANKIWVHKLERLVALSSPFGWEFKAWIKAATCDAKLYRLNLVSNAVGLPPSVVVESSSSVVWPWRCSWGGC